MHRATRVIDRSQQFLNVCLDDPKANIPAELLAPVIQYKAWAAFDAHLVGILVVRGQSGKGGSMVHASFNRIDINAESFGQFALHIPTGDVAAVSKKGAPQGP